jgi:hypothetical protein
MMRYKTCVAIALLACVSCVLAGVPGIAYAKYPGAVVAGYVLDEGGNVVPGANVTLWQEGQVWSSKFLYGNCQNPQLSRYANAHEYYWDDYHSMNADRYVLEGGYLFGFAYPVIIR